MFVDFQNPALCVGASCWDLRFVFGVLNSTKVFSDQPMSIHIYLHKIHIFILYIVHQLWTGMQALEKFHTKIDLADSLNDTVLLSVHSVGIKVNLANLFFGCQNQS